jgi:hypothetical protein
LAPISVKKPALGPWSNHHVYSLSPPLYRDSLLFTQPQITSEKQQVYTYLK